MSILTQAIARARSVNPEFVIKLAGDTPAQPQAPKLPAAPATPPAPAAPMAPGKQTALQNHANSFQQHIGSQSPAEQTAFWSSAIGSDGGKDLRGIYNYAGLPENGEQGAIGGAWALATNPRARTAYQAKELAATPEGQQLLQEQGKQWMERGGANQIRQSWGTDTGKESASSAFSGNLGTYLPLGLGLMTALGGAASGNKMVALLGMLAAAYGGYKMWGNYKTAKDPAMWAKSQAYIPEFDPTKTTGSPQEVELKRQQYLKAMQGRSDARSQLNGAMGSFGGFMNGESDSSAGVSKVGELWQPNLPDRANLAQSLRSHIDLHRMKKDILMDRELDPLAAGRLLAGIQYAENAIDHQPTVAGFGMAAAPVLGLAAGITIGSLFATTPAVQAALRQVGSGVLSGSARLGVI